MSNFVHLHVHTEYSLLDGLAQIKPLVKRAKEYDMKSLAITDHGVMYGAIDFYKTCKDEGIKPIIGMEAYVAKGSRADKDPNKKTNANHLLLLAKNLEGYRNLMELTSIGQLEGFYYKPRIDKEVLQQYASGLICTSACPAGEIAELLINGDYEGAKQAIQWYVDIFGKDYYLEIQRHRYHEYVDRITEPKIKEDITKMARYEKIINEGKIKLSQELGLPLIVTNDSHYINKEDAVAQDALVCVSTGNTVDQVDRLRFVDVPGYYLASPDEISQLFSDQPEAIKNTVTLADKCDIEITLGQWYFPKPDLPKGETEASHLRSEILRLAPERMGEITPEIKERIEFELETICSKGYAGYFLIYRDFAAWTKSQGIITNTRGSAAGSLVSYILGITTVDPIRYLLPFERFLNPYRPSPPDIDLDISDNRRMDMIEYITQKFGHDKVAQICTFGRMMAKAAVRDIARVLGYDYKTGDELSKMIPEGSQGFPMSLERAFKENPELKVRYETDSEAKKILDLAKKVEGNARHISVHAAAVVATPEKITHYSPLQRETKGDKIITQYEMHAAEEVGMIKFDILGITQLSIMNNAINIIKRLHDIEIDLEQISLEDEKTYDLLARGETLGVFQLGGNGMTKWLMELQPRKVEDIMAMIALFRPGPMANIPDYIARHHGQKPIEYFHPKAEKFLDKSYGVLVYQDDLLYCALELAGYNWEEVDKFRKAVGKKIPEEMAKQHIKFVDGCQKYSDMTEKEAEAVWDLFVPFQGYGFNKAHAASYGMVSYRSAYLKANYPVEFMTALLTADSGTTEKITADIEECRRMGITILSPDINQSDHDFTIVADSESLSNQAIRFGLSAIKNVGDAAVEAIIQERDQNGPFNNLTDFMTRVDGRKANKKVIESLIKVGAMDSFGNRRALLQMMEQVKAQIDKTQRAQSRGQSSLFDGGDGGDDFDIGKLPLPDISDFSLDEKLANEKELLGFYLTENPLAKRLSVLSTAVSHQIGELSAGRHYGKKVKLGGSLKSVRQVTTKKGNKAMAFATLEDGTGEIDLVVFPKTFKNTSECWKVDMLVVVEGKLDFRDDGTNLLVDEVTCVNNKGEGISLDEDQHTILIPRRTSQRKLMEINKILKASPGEDHITLLFENGGLATKALNVAFGVNFNPALRNTIHEILKNPL